MPDPRLKEIMEEVKAVLKKHDVGAYVLLSSQTHMEYLREYCPTWACTSLEETADGQGLQLRVRALRKDFPSKEAQGKMLADTVGMLAGTLDALNLEARVLQSILAEIGKVVEFEHMTKEE